MSVNVFELISLEKENVFSEIYTDRNKFVKVFREKEERGYPCKAQGPGKDGGIATVVRNGWNDDDVVLTVDVTFGTKTYSYQASKRYAGTYKVKTRFGISIVEVAYRWRQIDEFMAYIWELGYDHAVMFDSILVEKVVTKK